MSEPNHNSSAPGSRKHCRLSLVLALLQDGWSCQAWDASCTWLTAKDKSKTFCSQIWKRPESYYRVLLLAEHLFARPSNLKKICHLGSSAYYGDLLAMENLSAFRDLTQEACAAYKSKAGKGKGKASALPAAAAESFGDVEQAGAGQDEALVLRMPHEHLDLPPVSCKDPTLKDVKVLYDRFTHASGNLRCFSSCRHHDKCRRYTFVKNHASRAEAQSWLFAWVALGAKSKSAEGHKNENPTTAQVQSMMRLHSLL